MHRRGASFFFSLYIESLDEQPEKKIRFPGAIRYFLKFIMSPPHHLNKLRGEEGVCWGWGGGGQGHIAIGADIYGIDVHVGVRVAPCLHFIS